MLILSIFLMASCSGSVPQIGQIVWQINFVKAPGKAEVLPTLSLFVLIEDEDGISDIDSVYIIHEESELFWVLDSDSWILNMLSGKNWIGSNSLSMNNYSTLPDGKYRILVIDKAGERDSLQINISSDILTLNNNIIFPRLIIGSDILIESGFSENTLRIYDESMNLLKNLKIESGKINRSIISNDTNNTAHWICIYSFNQQTGTGLVQGPYLLNPFE